MGRGVRLRAPEPLGPAHSAIGFQSGRAAIDDWLQNARPVDGDAHAGIFVLASEDGRVVGYYTLAAGSVHGEESGRRGGTTPVIKLGRVGVDRALQGRGIGTALVLDAVARCHAVAAHAPVAALITDAPDAAASDWLTGLGFRPVRGRAMTLVMGMKTIEALCRT